MGKPVLDVRSLARSHTEKAVQTMAGLMHNSDQDSVRLAAAEALLTRGWGRPKPDESEGEQITVVIRRILEGPGITEAKPVNGQKAIEGEILPPEKPNGS